MQDNNSSAVHTSKKYNEFKIIEANRVVDRKHVQELIKSFSNSPDLSRTHPILVNENFEIIDGQHRFTAWQAMGVPIYYLQEKGLTVLDALRLNANQKAWKVGDYARAYAMSGKPQYQRLLELKDEFKFPYGIIIVYSLGWESKNLWRDFRNGSYHPSKDKNTSYERLEKLQEICDLRRDTRVVPRGFAAAMLECYKNPNWNNEFFVNKFKLVGEKELHNFAGRRTDWLRAIENIYNYYTSPEDQIRLF